MTFDRTVRTKFTTVFMEIVCKLFTREPQQTSEVPPADHHLDSTRGLEVALANEAAPLDPLKQLR